MRRSEKSTISGNQENDQRHEKERFGMQLI